MSKLGRLAWAALIGSVLLGCAGTYVRPAYVRNPGALIDPIRSLSYAAGQGGMLTEIHGNPFNAPEEELNRAVTETLESSHFGPDLPFFTTPPDGYSSAYRVVVLFSPGPGAAASKLCEDSNQPTAERTGFVDVMVAYCSNDTRLTSTQGSVAGATGPNDPAFRDLMSQIGLELFPPRIPDPNDGGDFDT
jgi:hypothetical protein